MLLPVLAAHAVEGKVGAAAPRVGENRFRKVIGLVVDRQRGTQAAAPTPGSVGGSCRWWGLAGAGGGSPLGQLQLVRAAGGGDDRSARGDGELGGGGPNPAAGGVDQHNVPSPYAAHKVE